MVLMEPGHQPAVRKAMNQIEYWKPVGQAWERMKDVLFRPFDFGKWMVIGFCAFLANCGRNGGSGGSGGSHSGGPNSGGDSFENSSPHEIAMSVKENLIDAWHEYTVWIVVITCVVLLIAFGITLFVNWLNSRGQFMFLDNVTKNRAAVSLPWGQYRKEANSLFVFQVLLGIASLAGVLVMLCGIGISVWKMMLAEQFIPSCLATAIGLIAGIIFFGMALGFIQMILRDFIVPLMYLNRCSIRNGAAVFVPLFKQHFWKFVLFGLVCWVVGLGIGVTVLLGAVLTCCCGFLLIAIPYIGTVVLLPVYVFQRCIGLEFIRQFGEEYDCFVEFDTNEPQLPIAPSPEIPSDPPPDSF